MDMFFNILMVVCFFPIVPILYFVMRNYTKPKKNLIINVTLPLDAREDEQVLKYCKTYRHRLGIAAIVFVVIFPLVFLIQSFSIVLTFYMIWLTVVIFVMYGIYSRYHMKLKRLKKERGWTSKTAVDLIVDDKVAWEPPKKLGPGLFFPPILFSLVPLVHNIVSDGLTAMLVVYIINAALVAAFYLLYRLLFRARPEIIDEDTTLSIALTKVRRYNWSKAWISTAWLTGIYNLFFWIFIQHAFGMIITTAAFVGAMLLVALNAEFSARKAQEELTANSGAEVYVDEDDYWIGGILYYNPNNKQTLVSERVGINMTVNMARPAGKFFIAITALTLIAMPFFGIAFMPMEFTPLRIDVTDSAVIMRHSTKITVDISDIVEVELREDLRPISRQAGTNLPSLYAGRWLISNIGTATLRLNPQYPPFIVITTDNRTYIFGTSDVERTLEAYQKLRQRLD